MNKNKIERAKTILNSEFFDREKREGGREREKKKERKQNKTTLAVSELGESFWVRIECPEPEGLDPDTGPDPGLGLDPQRWSNIREYPSLRIKLLERMGGGGGGGRGGRRKKK